MIEGDIGRTIRADIARSSAKYWSAMLNPEYVAKFIYCRFVSALTHLPNIVQFPLDTGGDGPDRGYQYAQRIGRDLRSGLYRIQLWLPLG